MKNFNIRTFDDLLALDDAPYLRISVPEIPLPPQILALSNAIRKEYVA